MVDLRTASDAGVAFFKMQSLNPYLQDIGVVDEKGLLVVKPFDRILKTAFQGRRKGTKILPFILNAIAKASVDDDEKRKMLLGVFATSAKRSFGISPLRFLPPEFDLKFAEHAWEQLTKRTNTREMFYKLADQYGILPEIYCLAESGTEYKFVDTMTYSFVELLDIWCEKQGIDLSGMMFERDWDDQPKPVVQNASPLKAGFSHMAPPPDWMPLHGVTEVFRHGDPTVILPTPLRTQQDNHDDFRDVSKPEHRERYIAAMLLKIGVTPDHYIGGYRDENERKFALHLETPEGGVSVILVTDYGSIFVFKPDEFYPSQLPLWINPDEKQEALSLPETPIDDGTPYLIDRLDVWKTNITHSERDLKRWVFAPAHLIKPQEAKRHVSWSDQGLAAYYTIISKIVRDGKMFSTSDEALIRFGRLASVRGATPKKLYGGLQSGSLTLFAREGIRTFKQAEQYLMATNPILDRFKNRKGFSGIDLFKVAATNIVRGRDVFDTSDCISSPLAHRGEDEISFALKHDGVRGLQPVIRPDYKGALTSADDFLIASGLLVHGKSREPQLISSERAARFLDGLESRVG